MTSPTAPTADLVAADLAKLINPGLRSPRADLAVLPGLALVQADIRRGGRSVPDAIETVVNRGLAAMGADPPGPGLPRLAADPVKALRAALALRPGSERVKSKTRRTAAAQALGLLSGDGWRAHHEKPLLRDLADAMRKNPKLKVFSANGLFDLATPFFLTEFDLNHMMVTPELQKNVEFGYYPAGHMVYLNVDALKDFKHDLAGFYAETGH